MQEPARLELDFGRSRRFDAARDIIAVHGARNYAEVEIEGASRPGITRTTLESVLQQHPIRLVRVHRSHLVAIISGEGRATGTDAGKPYCLRYQSSNVLIRREIGWRAVLSHVSGVNTQCD